VRNTRFLYTKVMGEEMAAKLGVRAAPTDALATVALLVPLALSVVGLEGLRRLPGGEERVQAWAVARMKRLLKKTGEAQYSTDENLYSMGAQGARRKRGTRPQQLLRKLYKATRAPRDAAAA